MDNDKKPNSEPRNSSTVWVALLLLGVVAMCLFLILSQSSHELTYPEFEQLVANSTKAEGAEGSATTGKLITGSKKKYVFSDLRDVVIGPNQIEAMALIYEQGKEGMPSAQEPKKFTVNKDSSDETNKRLHALLEDSNIKWEFSTGPTFLEKYGMMLSLMCLMLVFFWYMMRRLGGAGGPMQFGRSRGRLYAEEDLGVSFSDVAGIDEAVEEVKEVVDFLNNAEKYQKLGGKIPCGVLLVGPPGTGKTLLAKAIAGEAGVPFFSLSGSDFVEMFVGVGAARVRDMFQQAEAKAPCIIFIDELDALGKTRGNGAPGGHDEREQTLNALLVEMDGFASNSGVIVMAATNRPETLDQALMRPGRFDRHVLVDRPDVRGREEILNLHLRKKRDELLDK